MLNFILFPFFKYNTEVNPVLSEFSLISYVFFIIHKSYEREEFKNLRIFTKQLG